MIRKIFFIAFLIVVTSSLTYTKELPSDYYDPSYEPIAAHHSEPELSPQEQEREKLRQEFDAMIHPFDVVDATKQFVDGDGNGKFEALAVTLDMTSRVADGLYRIDAGLITLEGYSYRGDARDQCDLKDGACTVRFEFPNDHFLVFDLADIYRIDIEVYALEKTELYAFAERMFKKLESQGEMDDLKHRGMEIFNESEVFSFMFPPEGLPDMEPMDVLLGRKEEIAQDGIKNEEGEIEQLRVIVPVLSRYQAQARLLACIYGDSQGQSRKSLMCEEFFCSLEPGKNACPVDFDASVLARAEASGPHDMNINLESHTPSIAPFVQVQIPGFSADQYISPVVKLKRERFSTILGDPDMNGLHNVLIIQSKAKVKVSGEYMFNGNLADADGNYIGFFSQKNTLRADGEEYVSIGIPGAVLKEGNFNGPYRFYDCMLYLDQGAETSKNLFSETRCDYKTPELRAGEFE